jgi:hypothetical protein
MTRRTPGLAIAGVLTAVLDAQTAPADLILTNGKISMPLYRRVEPNVRVLEYECPAMIEAQKDANRP